MCGSVLLSFGHKCMLQVIMFGTTLAAMVPTKRKPATPATKRNGGLQSRLHSPLLRHYPTLSSHPICPQNMSKSSRLFGLTKRSFIHYLWHQHQHESNITI